MKKLILSLLIITGVHSSMSLFSETSTPTDTNDTQPAATSQPATAKKTSEKTSSLTDILKQFTDNVIVSVKEESKTPSTATTDAK